jgi:hypothetical protein
MPEGNGPTPLTAEEAKYKDKFDAQKRVLQRIVLATLEGGKVNGLTAGQVGALQDGLYALGWVPLDVKV